MEAGVPSTVYLMAIPNVDNVDQVREEEETSRIEAREVERLLIISKVIKRSEVARVSLSSTFIARARFEGSAWKAGEDTDRLGYNLMTSP